MSIKTSFSLLSLLLVAACGGTGVGIPKGPMPQGGTFTGVYHSPQYGEMHMIQNGGAVVAEYKKEMRTGKIQGEVDGNYVEFEWVENKAMVSNRPTKTIGHGFFLYKIDPGNGDHVLTGKWGLGDSMDDGGEWNAYKNQRRDPELSSSGGESSDDDEEDYDDDDLGSDSDDDDEEEEDDF